MKTCPDCGAKVPGNVCPECGKAMGGGKMPPAGPSKKAPPFAGKKSLAQAMKGKK